MALSARQHSKVIKPQRPFCVFASNRPKTVQKRRRNHGYKIDAKSVFAPAWARQPPQTGLPYMFEASLQRLCRAILPAEGQIKKARKFPMQNQISAPVVDDARAALEFVFVRTPANRFSAVGNEKHLLLYNNSARYRNGF